MSQGQRSAEDIVLYVDDEKANCVVFEHSFSDRFQIVCAQSPLDALQLLEEIPVAVLISDQRMPEMTGNELLERVKEKHPHIVRIVLTAYGDLDPILRAVNDGLVARYILKPWDREELEEILEWAVQAHRVGTTEPYVQNRLLEVERLANMGRITGAVFHDFTQPLSYIYNNALSLQATLEGLMPVLRQLPQPNDPLTSRKLADASAEIPEILEDIMAGCVLMRDLHANTRRLLHPELAADEPPSDPKYCIDFAIGVMRNSRTHATILSEIDGETLPPVAMANSELTQTLINLVANSVQALNCVEPGAGTIRVIGRVEGTNVRIEVRDNGPGMSPKEIVHARRPFVSGRPGGTGLGLSQCQRLVGGCGGTFEIESEVGVGTVVTLILPQTKTREAASS